MTPYRDFEDWYLEQRPRLLATMLVLTRNVTEAAEVTDEAFARALAHWSRVRTMRSPGGWAYTVALNLARRSMSQSARNRQLASQLAPMPIIDTTFLIETLDLISRLPRRQRQVLALRYIADLPEARIASVLGTSRSAVASALRDARRTLAIQTSARSPTRDRTAAPDPSS